MTHIQLAGPGFGHPGKIALLLRVDIFVEVMHHGWWLRAPGSPVASETEFEWVLAVGMDYCSFIQQVSLLSRVLGMLRHAEAVPETDLEKSTHNVFYLPMHTVRKQSSTTTKVRAIFDAFAKLLTGVSLNDILLVGAKVTSLLTNVLLCFSFHYVTVTTDINCVPLLSLSPIGNCVSSYCTKIQTNF